MAALRTQGIVRSQHKRHLGDIETRTTANARKIDIMAYANAHIHRSSGIFAALGETISSLVSAWQRSRMFMRTYSELSALSDRELHDMAINRSMISRLAYEAAYGRDD